MWGVGYGSSDDNEIKQDSAVAVRVVDRVPDPLRILLLRLLLPRGSLGGRGVWAEDGGDDAVCVSDVPLMVGDTAEPTEFLLGGDTEPGISAGALCRSVDEYCFWVAGMP